MKSSELKALQDRIKFDAISMSVCIGVPYNTYRNYLYEYMDKDIPAHAERSALELEQMQKTFDIQRDLDYCQFLDRQFPHGIPSELS